MIKKFNDLVIIVILWIFSIYSIIVVMTNSYVIGLPNFLGYGLLLGITILRFFKFKHFKTFLGVLLLIGSINTIQYTYYTSTFIFTWTPFGQSFSSFGIQPLSSIMLILLIILNYSDFRKLTNDIFKEDPKIAAERYKLIVQKNYDSLKNENDNKLQEIVDNKKTYQQAYVKAAQKLIEERKNKQINAP